MRRSLPGGEFDDRIDAVAQRGLADRVLRGAILRAISPALPFDSYVWLSTDPETAVGCVPLAEVPDVRQVPSLIRNRYLVEERHWANPLTPVVTTLASASNGTLGQRTWTEQLAAHGVTDVATMVLRDAYGCWGFIDLWRIGGSFSAKECTTLEACASVVTTAARCSLLPTFAQSTSGGAPMDEPAIVLLDDELSLITQTAQAQAHLRALLPPSPDDAPIPAAVYNVAAQLLANEVGVVGQAARARLPLGGRWLTTRAARAWPARDDPPRSLSASNGRHAVSGRTYTHVSLDSAHAKGRSCGYWSSAVTLERSPSGCSSQPTLSRTTSSRSSPRLVCTTARSSSPAPPGDQRRRGEKVWDGSELPRKLCLRSAGPDYDVVLLGHVEPARKGFEVRRIVVSSIGVKKRRLSTCHNRRLGRTSSPVVSTNASGDDATRFAGSVVLACSD